MSQFACGLCKENHPLRLCAEFRRMTPEIRLRTALIYRYCSNCLASNHAINECDSVIRCKRCGKAHHTMLHNPSSDIEEESDEDVVELTWAQQVEEEEAMMAEIENSGSNEQINTKPENTLPTNAALLHPYRPPLNRTQSAPRSTTQHFQLTPLDEDRARLDSSRRLQRAGVFRSNWRHGSDRLRLDSSQRRIPDRTRLDSSRRLPQSKRRRGQGARRRRDMRTIIERRSAALPGSRCWRYHPRC